MVSRMFRYRNLWPAVTTVVLPAVTTSVLIYAQLLSVLGKCAQTQMSMIMQSCQVFILAATQQVSSLEATARVPYSNRVSR